MQLSRFPAWPVSGPNQQVPIECCIKIERACGGTYMCGWRGAPAVDWRVASPWRAGCQGPAASSCPSPLTRATDSAVLSSWRFAIAQGLGHHAPTGITRSPSLISSPPAHSKQSHWSFHACHLLWSSHLLELVINNTQTRG